MVETTGRMIIHGEKYSDSEFFFQYFKLRRNVRHK